MRGWHCVLDATSKESLTRIAAHLSRKYHRASSQNAHWHLRSWSATSVTWSETSTQHAGEQQPMTQRDLRVENVNAQDTRRMSLAQGACGHDDGRGGHRAQSRRSRPSTRASPGHQYRASPPLGPSAYLVERLYEGRGGRKVSKVFPRS